eukprot:scaffold110165_cov29-Tisochrysis_lutea.AAC.2
MPTLEHPNELRGLVERLCRVGERKSQPPQCLDASCLMLQRWPFLAEQSGGQRLMRDVWVPHPSLRGAHRRSLYHRFAYRLIILRPLPLVRRSARSCCTLSGCRPLRCAFAQPAGRVAGCAG